jgi:hypothetical protein
MWVVKLRGYGEVISVEVPKKPVETENKMQFEVYINRPDGTLDTVYRFEKYSVVSILEVK